MVQQQVLDGRLAWTRNTHTGGVSGSAQEGFKTELPIATKFVWERRGG